jgi:predicted ATP-grasp superfamily ATP-dependent carboligase
MLGDIEEDAFWAIELDLEAPDPVAALVHVMLAAQALELLCDLLDVLDENAEMMQAGIVEALAELVGLEP